MIKMGCGARLVRASSYLFDSCCELCVRRGGAVLGQIVGRALIPERGMRPVGRWSDCRKQVLKAFVLHSGRRAFRIAGYSDLLNKGLV